VTVQAFIEEYFEAWSGTDEEDLILSHYSETISLEIPGTIINGKVALRDQFVRPFVAGFPGNHHVVKNMIFGKDGRRRGVELRSCSQRDFRWHRCNRHGGKPARMRGVSIRPGKATGHRGPHLLRRHDITQANFIAPASGAHEPSYIVVRRSGQSTARERVRICPFPLIQ
jgi:hypothetical protein